MTDQPSARWRRLLFIPPIVIGLAIVFWAASGKAPPAKAKRGEPVRSVRIIEAPSVDLVPIAEGYGTVQPDRVWTAVAQVRGRVVDTHPELQNGRILPAGTVLLRIDPVDYELALGQAQAELAQLAVQEQNARDSLTIEERSLVLAQQEVERQRSLVRQSTTSQSAADQAERTMLSSRAAVQNLRNTLALIPIQRRLLDSKVAQATRDLEHTTIGAPFNLRVANLQVEMHQFVSVGQSLFEGDSVDRVEVVAQVAMSSLRRLVIGRPEFKLDLAQLNKQVAETVGFRPLVRLDMGNHVAQWAAEFVRFSDNVDPETRTIGVVVAVDKPFEKVRPGYRPPLSKGMFVQVLLRGRPQPDRLVVPRSAVRGGAVYVADVDDRLRRQPVTVLYDQGGLSVIGAGLTPGARVVVSDLVPAVEGMLLRPEVDEAVTTELRAAAEGAA